MRLASPGTAVIFSESEARGAVVERLVAAAGLAELTARTATVDACVALRRTRRVSWLVVDLGSDLAHRPDEVLAVLDRLLAGGEAPAESSARPPETVVVLPSFQEAMARAVASRAVDELVIYDGEASEPEAAARFGLARARRERDAARKATALVGRDRFLRVVAHDLRNPLNVLSVAVSTLRRGVPADRAAMYMDKMVRAAEKMNRLIEDLLDATRLDAGHVVLARDEHPAPGVVDEVLARIEPAAKERGVSLEAAVSQPPPDLRLHVDREQTVKALAHLLRHAILVAAPGARLVLAVTGDGAQVHFEVLGLRADLASEERAIAFEPYSAAPAGNGTAARPSSNELGLAIARGFAEVHGGSLRAAARPDGTVALTLSLPAYTEREATPA